MITLTSPDIDDRTRVPELEDIQCNVLAPHRRNRAVYLLVRLPDEPAVTRRYLHDWAGRATSMAKQVAEESQRRAFKHSLQLDPQASLEFSLRLKPRLWAEGGTPPPVARRGLVRSIMLSAQGVRKFFPGSTILGKEDTYWREGMRDRERETFWEEPTPTEAILEWAQKPYLDPLGIDALIILAADGVPQDTPDRAQFPRPSALADAVADELNRLNQTGSAVVLDQIDGYLSRREPRGRVQEHFGFFDGLSTPLFLRSDREWAARNQPGPDFGTTVGNVLFELPLPAEVPPSSPRYGSYCVFRQIEQKAKFFAELDAQKAAKLIGRDQEDGRPLVPGTDGGAHINDFKDFSAAPGCPFHAHIRKANPRGEGTGPQPVAKVLFPRRGMLYGDRARDPVTGRFTSLPDDGVGLLFMGYLSELVNFVRMQKEWMGHAAFPQPGHGRDELVGKASSAPGDLPRYTRVLGGEYFFVPPISWLAHPF